VQETEKEKKIAAYHENNDEQLNSAGCLAKIILATEMQQKETQEMK
jgi:hypothetical protein